MKVDRFDVCAIATALVTYALWWKTGHVGFLWACGHASGYLQAKGHFQKK